MKKKIGRSKFFLSFNINQSRTIYNKIRKMEKMLVDKVIDETLLPKEGSGIFSTNLLHTIIDKELNTVL